MTSFVFWQRWLFAVALVIILFGLALAFFNQTPVFDLLFNRQVDPVFWGGQGPPAESAAFQRWAYGVLGATVAGWGVFLAFIAAAPFRRRERWAWSCVALGIALWYLADTALSLANRVYFNAAFNTLLLVLVALPLVLTRRQFERPAPRGS